MLNGKERARTALNGLIRKYEELKCNKEFSSNESQVSQDKQLPFIKLCDKMLSLNKKLQEIGDKNTLEKQKIQEEINKTDNKIDELVYQLYGITEEENVENFY